MARPRIVLELDSARTVTRIGLTLSASKGVRRVRWEDGSEADVRIGRGEGSECFEVDEATFNHLRLLGAQWVHDVLHRFPVETFLLAVRDAPATSKGVDPVDVLMKAGADGVEEVWKRARTALAESVYVKRAPGSARRYTWTGKDAPGLDAWVALVPPTSTELGAGITRSTESNAAGPSAAPGSVRSDQDSQKVQGNSTPSPARGAPPARSRARRPTRPEAPTLKPPALPADLSNPVIRREGSATNVNSTAPPQRRAPRAPRAPRAAAAPTASGPAVEAQATSSGSPPAPPGRTPAPRTPKPPVTVSNAAPSSGTRSRPASATSARAARTATGSIEQLTRQLLRGKISDANRSALEDLVQRPAQGTVPALVLSAVTGEFDARLAQSAAVTPLATGARIAAYTEDVIAAIADAAGDRRAAALLAAVTKKVPRIDDVDFVRLTQPGELQSLLERALTELRNTADPAALRPGLEAMVDRILNSPDAPAIGLRPVLEVMSALPGGDAQQARLTRVVNLIADILKRAGPAGVAAVSDSDKQAIARAQARLPLTGTGSRATVLSIVASADVTEIAQSRWWRDVTIDDLANITSGPLLPVLELASVVDAVVRPLAVEAIRHVKTRRGLGHMLAASRPVAEALPADAVSDALVRVSRTDAPLRSWLDVVRDTEALSALEVERDQMAKDLHQKTRELARAEEDVQRLRSSAARLESRVHEAERARTAMRGSQERQIRIDAMRALAGLAAFVEGSIDRLEPARLKARVSALVRRQGIGSIETPDDVVAFDPARHESVGPAIQPGQKVVVRRCGYTWDSPQEEVVLVRALVERAEHEEDR